MYNKQIAQFQYIEDPNFSKEHKWFVKVINRQAYKSSFLVEKTMGNQDLVNENTIPHILRQFSKLYNMDNSTVCFQDIVDKYKNFIELIQTSLVVLIPKMNTRNLTSTAKSLAFLKWQDNLLFEEIKKQIIFKINNKTNAEDINILDFIDFLQATVLFEKNIQPELLEYIQNKLSDIALLETKDLIRLAEVVFFSKKNMDNLSPQIRYAINDELYVRLQVQPSVFFGKDLEFIYNLYVKHIFTKKLGDLVLQEIVSRETKRTTEIKTEIADICGKKTLN